MIRIRDLHKEINGKQILSRCTLHLEAGKIHALIGPNGSGKTTTINLLLGLLEPTAGRAEVLGFDTRTRAEEIRARTGALLEHTGLYEQMSAEENLEFYGRVWCMPEPERRDRIRELLTGMGVWDRREERVVGWSRGMKQKLALARALIHRPPLVFLDEPTAGLDVVAAAALREDLSALAAREGVTVFLTTHNMLEAERLCARVAVIREGRLIAIGHPDELRARSGGPRFEVVGSGFDENVAGLLRARPEVSAIEINDSRLLVHLSGETDVAPLVSLIVGAGAQVEEVRKGKASLEEVFLTMMEEGQ
jgi:ABC-2 type transport system ATP-binding protein